MTFNFSRYVFCLLICICFFSYSACNYKNLADNEDLLNEDLSDENLTETEKLLDSLKKDSKNSDFVKSYEKLSDEIKSLDSLIPEQIDAPEPVPNVSSEFSEADRKLQEEALKEWEKRNKEYQVKRNLVINVQTTQNAKLNSILIVKSHTSSLQSLVLSVRTTGLDAVSSKSDFSQFQIEEVFNKIDKAIRDAEQLKRLIKSSKQAKKEAQEAFEKTSALKENKDEIQKAVQSVENRLKALEDDVIPDTEEFAQDEKEAMIFIKVTMTAMKVVSDIQNASKQANQIITRAKNIPDSKTKAEQLKTELNQITETIQLAITQAAASLKAEKASARSKAFVDNAVSYTQKAEQSMQNLKTQILDLSNLNTIKQRVKTLYNKNFEEYLDSMQETLKEIEEVKKQMKNIFE